MQTTRPPLTLSWLGTVSQGKQLELGAKTDTENIILAKIVADESLLFELYIEIQTALIPLEVIRKAIEVDKNNVHSEVWHENNVYLDPEST